MEMLKEYDAKVDAKRRVTLRGSAFDYYHVAEYADGTIILAPRELTRPFQVSERTLGMMDESVANFRQGDVSEPLDISEFATL